ncbi:MAG: hypothetical protein CMG34_06500 [Candidatus Marinimicrobia bacterium]|nr:hypothetical protein [Candidatus Neomarinimicrobiota bacterium]|tara:strand:+ start:1325 stop:1945 length:621 start_codon:yes stop_codon:yes gene_type:complete
MASTTIDTDTELSAVNSILGAIGQSPVTSIVFDNPEVSFIYNLLRDANVDVQAEGWHFNTEKHVTYTPDSVTGKIAIGNDILKMDVTDGWTHRKFDVVKRGGYLYDKYDHTDDWSDATEILLDIIKLVSFNDLPAVFKRYIIAKASSKAATQLVVNPQLVQLLQQQEAFARATLMEYECNQGNHSMMGYPEDTVYTTYEPWRGLRR